MALAVLGSRAWFTILVLAVAPTAICAASKNEEVPCNSLGFNDFLLCSQCNQLKTFVTDQQLIKECFQCCSADKEEERVLYASAILEACPMMIRSYPFIDAFIKEKAKKYSNLDSTMRPGVVPRLVMYDDNGASTVVQIRNWKTEDIVEYLDNKLAVATSK